MCDFEENSAMNEIDIRVFDSLADINAVAWDDMTDDNPTVKHAWLQSMIDSGCTTAASGWLPQFLALTREIDGRKQLAGAVPLYVKNHSYGEYVFDWAWADAYHRAGLDYYPKLVCAVPFTPCSGTRILAKTHHDREALIRAMILLAQDAEVSSLHVLFSTGEEQLALLQQGMMARQNVQFHWENKNYANFADFLAVMSHDKRKKIKQERRRIELAGVTFQIKRSREITAADWDFFMACYQHTYAQHRSIPYLNRDFFALVGERMPDNLLLVIASQHGARIAASLSLFNSQTLYGRYWGAKLPLSGLHFETCYYQPQEFCIENNIRFFEGGAQGEHKLARGFTPVTCHSAHLIKDARFAGAVGNFLEREAGGIDQYINELTTHLPFKQAL